MCVASGRPAPRIASVGHLFVNTPDDVGLDVRDRVATAHHERPERRDQRGQQHVVRAEVGDDLHVEGGDRAVPLGAHLDVARSGRGPGG